MFQEVIYLILQATIAADDNKNIVVAENAVINF
jgi:hypothetical protein